METRRITTLVSRYTRARCTYRSFTTHPPHRLDSTPPAPPSPPSTDRPTPYYPLSNLANHKSGPRFKFAASLVDETAKRDALSRVRQYDAKQRTIAELEKSGRTRDLERQQWRKWKAGDVYAPHDLSPVEMGKWKVRRTGGRDVFDMLGINPLMEYKVRFFLFWLHAVW